MSGKITIGNINTGINIEFEDLLSALLICNENFCSGLGVYNDDYVYCQVPYDRYHVATDFDINYYAEKKNAVRIPVTFSLDNYLKYEKLQTAVDSYLSTCFPYAYLRYDANKKMFFIWHRHLELELIRYEIRQKQAHKTCEEMADHYTWDTYRIIAEYETEIKQLLEEYRGKGGIFIETHRWEDLEEDYSELKKVLVKR